MRRTVYALVLATAPVSHPGPAGPAGQGQAARRTKVGRRVDVTVTFAARTTRAAGVLPGNPRSRQSSPASREEQRVPAAWPGQSFRRRVTRFTWDRPREPPRDLIVRIGLHSERLSVRGPRRGPAEAGRGHPHSWSTCHRRVRELNAPDTMIQCPACAESFEPRQSGRTDRPRLCPALWAHRRPLAPRRRGRRRR